MSDKIFAPFSDEQVVALNEWQSSGVAHPFTCALAHSNGHVNLVATTGGWRCSDPSCTYVQDWAHASMADGYLLGKLYELAHMTKSAKDRK